MPNHPKIALEMLDIYRVKADNSRIQADIRLREDLPEKIWPIRVLENLLNTVEGLEYFCDGCFVGFLFPMRVLVTISHTHTPSRHRLRRKPGFINPVIHSSINPLIQLINLLSEILGIVCDPLLALINKVIKLRV